MTERFTASSPADILGFIPHVLGFTPTNSFVFLTIQAKTLGATMRVDAPATAAAPLDYARRLISYLAADEKATGTLLAIYSDQDPGKGNRPFPDHVETIIQELELANMPLKDAWLVTSRHWRDALCGEDCRCSGNQPLDAITDSPLNAAMIYRGSNHHTDPAAEFAPFTGRPDTAGRILAAVPAGTAENIEASRTLWEHTLNAGVTPGPDEALELTAAFQHVFIRDVLMADVVTDKLPDTFEGIGRIFLGEGITPDWARVDTAQAIARSLINAAPEGCRAPMLCLNGWLEYLKGNASRAADHFDLAAADTPGYRLAELLSRLITHRIAPTAQNPDTAYRRFR